MVLIDMVKLFLVVILRKTALAASVVSLGISPGPCLLPLILFLKAFIFKSLRETLVM